MKSLRMESPAGAEVTISGREYDYFCGTGYLGLQNHPAVTQAAHETLERYGVSTATSRGGFGEHEVYDWFEREACAFFQAEKVLYLPSGYLGMAVLTQATSGQFEHIFIDAQAHYSLWDAAQATNMPITPFPHRDADRLAELLRSELERHARPVILSDGVFPVSGEIAPLPADLELAEKAGGRVYLDDAHAVGVLGATGRGVAEYFGVEGEGCRSCGTLAKALGGYGGVIWGDRRFIDKIDANSRILAGVSPPPLVTAAASAAALAVARQEPERRAKLVENVAHARAAFRAAGWDLQEDTPVPILCVRARTGVNLSRMQARLFEEGIAVEYEWGYPSTPAGGALRIAIFATHTQEQIDRLVAAIGAAHRRTASGTA